MKVMLEFFYMIWMMDNPVLPNLQCGSREAGICNAG